MRKVTKTEVHGWKKSSLIKHNKSFQTVDQQRLDLWNGHKIKENTFSDCRSTKLRSLNKAPGWDSQWVFKVGEPGCHSVILKQLRILKIKYLM